MKRPALKMPRVRFERLLPILSGGLIAGLFVIAGLVLLSPNIEPETPPRGAVTSVAINGFQGLRKALEAEGYHTRLNRQEAGGRKQGDDLMIVTLDGDAVLYEWARHDRVDVRPAKDAGGNIQGWVGEGDDGYVNLPNPRKAQQLLYEPLGQAVLVVAPKWHVPMIDPRKPRWAGETTFMSEFNAMKALGLLSPIAVIDTDMDTGEKSYLFRPQNYRLSRADLERGQSYAVKPAAGQEIVGTGFTSGKIIGLQSISGPNLTPLLVGPNGEVLLSKVNPAAGEKAFTAPVYLLSDPDLLNNSMFAHPERMAGMLKVIEQLTGKAQAKVVFDITFNDLAQDSDLLHHISRPPFVGVPLALMVLALGLVWVAAARFGPAHNPYSETPHGRGVRTLADNAARLVAKAGRETKLMPAYAQLVRDQVLKQAGFVPNALMTADEMADRLSERHGTDEFYGNLFAEAGTVKGIGHMLVLAKKLRHWKSQITKTEA